MFSALMPGAASTQAARTDAIFFILLALGGGDHPARARRSSSPSRSGSGAAPGRTRGELPAFISREFEIGWTAATLFVFLFLFWWAGSAQLSALVAAQGRARNPRRRQAMDVEDPARQRRARDQRAARPRRRARAARHDLAGRDPLLLHAGLPHEEGRAAGPLHRDVVRGQQDRRVPPVLRRVLRHRSFPHDRPHRRHAARTSTPAGSAPSRRATTSPTRARALFVARGCSGCHAPSSKVHAPNLAGLYGRTVQLASGRTVVADDAYIRDSILQPKRDIAAGYEPIMPSFSGVLSDGEIQSLVAYIRSLGSGPEGDGTDRETSESLVPGPRPSAAPP